MSHITVDRPRAQGYGCSIGDDYFRLVPSDVSPVQVYTQDSLAPRQQQQSGSQGENVLTVGHAFSRQNLTGGEGLDWWPRVAGERRTELDLIRFWDSENMDIRRPEAGQRFTTTLSRQFETWWTPPSGVTDMGVSRDAIYVAEGSDIHRFDDWADTTAEDTDTMPSAIESIEVGQDDTVVVVLDNGDIHVKPSDSEVYVLCYDESAEATPPVAAAWWVKGRIIAAAKDGASAEAGSVLEIDPGIGGTPATPTSTAVITTIDTYSGSMLSCVDAGHAIVGGFSDGSLRSYVPQTDSAGGTPVLTVRAKTKMPQHEEPVTLGWNLGQLLVLGFEESPTGGSDSKTLRFYTTTVQDARFDYAVGGGDMQLIRAWKGVDERSPHYTKRFTTTRDQAYFTVGEATDTFHVWRYDFVTQGLFRHLAADLDCGRAITIFDNRLAACDGSAIQLESTDTYAAEGYLITPNITFGLNSDIAWHSFVAEVDGLETAGVKVELYRSTNPDAILDPDHSSWVQVESLTDISDSGREMGAVNVESPSLTLMVKLYRSNDGLTAPDVRRFATRGLPSHRDYVVEIPVAIDDIIRVPGRMPLRVPNYGDEIHETLFQLQGKSRTFDLYDPPVTVQGQVESLAEPVTYMTSRGSQGRYCMVRILGRLLGTSLESVQGDDGIGIGMMGVTTMGIGEAEAT